MRAEGFETGSVDVVLKEITHSLLYEGYALYPYRESAPKNKLPTPFGVLYPSVCCAQNKNLHSRLKTECVLRSGPSTQVEVTVQFLQVVFPDHQGWTAHERTVNMHPLVIGDILGNPTAVPFTFPDPCHPTSELQPVSGSLVVTARSTPERDVHILSAIAINTTSSVSPAILHHCLEHSLVSTHLILRTDNGEFISSQDPGERWLKLTSQCMNENTWPVLVGQRNKVVLSSPIVLYDHPYVNESSGGDLFDATEMEEALFLHMEVLSDSEKKELLKDKRQMEMIRELAARTSPDAILRLHDHLKEKRNKK